MRRLLIVGAGGHGCWHSCGGGFVDDAAPGLTQVGGYPVLGATDDVSAYRAQADAAIVAVGNNELREVLINKLAAAGFELGIVVDHDAQVHDFGHLGVNACMSGGSVLGGSASMQVGVVLRAAHHPTS